MESDMPSYDPSKALTVRQVAELVHVSQPTVRGWIRDGMLPSLELGGCRRVLRRDLDEFVSRHRVYGLRPLRGRRGSAASECGYGPDGYEEVRF